MENINNMILDFDGSLVNKKVIPDNDYLPFVSVSQVFMDMNPGDIVVWPISKINAVRITSARMKLKKGRTYKYSTDKGSQTVSVCRVV